MAAESRHAVVLAGREIGVLHQRADYVRFNFLPDYWDDPERHVLGLWFEDNRDAPVASSLRLPAWFANLLPEGRLREFIASERGVSPDRDMELLAQVGHDLPGAIEVVDGKGADMPWRPVEDARGEVGLNLSSGPIKFSLAGVGLKFSMRRQGERFTIPASGERSGDWIVKLPDPRYPSVPANEFAMMQLARCIGIDVPDVYLLHRDASFGLPDHLWPPGEDFALAVRRFDRLDDGTRVHIEDFAQVRGFPADRKYSGSFETIGALCYRGVNLDSLQEFARRLVFNVVVGNGDAHLKNWSLIYGDGRNPSLSPAYDLVCTAAYSDHDDLGLSFGGSRRFEAVSLATFGQFQDRLRVAEISLADIAQQTYRSIAEAWDRSSLPAGLDDVGSWIEQSIAAASRRFT